jgi:hypothetical protein
MAPFVDALLPFEAHPDDPALRTLIASLQVDAAPPTRTRATGTVSRATSARFASPPARPSARRARAAGGALSRDDGLG